MTSRVFLPHAVMTDRNGTEPPRWKFDIARVAATYGDVICLMGDSNTIVVYDAALDLISTELRINAFNPAEDYFLAAGDMTCYAAMLLVAANDYGMTPRQLRHNRKSGGYTVLRPFRLTFSAEANVTP
jgi:hypothetical protein